MEIVLENINENDWEFSATITSSDIIGITGPEYEELLDILSLKKLPTGKISIDGIEITEDNYLEYHKVILLKCHLFLKRK